MMILRLPLILGVATVLAAVSIGAAQQQPRIGYVYPAGGRQGATAEITVGGQSLDGVNGVRVSGSGITATIIEHEKPVNQGQFGQLRDRLGELQKMDKDAAVLKEIADIVRKMAIFVKRSSTPAIGETVRIRLTIAADAAPGKRELRLVTPNGLSNPRTFYVGQLPEFSERSATATAPDANIVAVMRDLRFRNQQVARPASEMSITLPATVNGQILPGGISRYRFQASKGLGLVVAVRARELTPYLADAVPGWFQASITLRDDKGNELAAADHFRFDPDPVLYCEIPRDGEYVMEIRDSLFRGREDFVYRVTVGDVPFVSSIYPLGGKPGAVTAIETRGWNLGCSPGGALSQKFDASGKAPGVYPMTANGGDRVSNSVPFAVDDLPECIANGSNHSIKDAQAVSTPIIVNGRIEKPGQWDVFRIEGRAGEEIVAEVTARRLGSPLDSVLKITDADSKQLAFNDDHEDKGVGLNTHHADSYVRVKLPATGAYFVHVGDAQRQSGAEFAYRLRISPPRPDFALRIAPSSVTVRAGSSVPLTVFALRKDGFADQITLTLKGPSGGITISGGRIPAGHDEVRITLAAPFAGMKQPISLAVEGQARIAGQTVAHRAAPAEDMMQAFAYRHLVCAEELTVAVVGRIAARVPPSIIGGTEGSPVRIPAGWTATVRINLPKRLPGGELQLDLNEPPDGISIESVNPLLQGSEIVLRCDAGKVKPGYKANLIVNIFVLPDPPASAPANRPATQRRRMIGVLPAIPFEIVAPK